MATLRLDNRPRVSADSLSAHVGKTVILSGQVESSSASALVVMSAVRARARARAAFSLRADRTSPRRLSARAAPSLPHPNLHAAQSKAPVHVHLGPGAHVPGGKFVEVTGKVNPDGKSITAVRAARLLAWDARARACDCVVRAPV